MPSQQFCLNGASGSVYFPRSDTVYFRGYLQIPTAMKSPLATSPLSKPKQVTASFLVNLGIKALNNEVENKYIHHITASHIQIDNGASLVSDCGLLCQAQQNLTTIIECDTFTLLDSSKLVSLKEAVSEGTGTWSQMSITCSKMDLSGGSSIEL